MTLAFWDLGFDLYVVVCLTATWYVCVESEPTTMKTPIITQNMYAITHHAKFGNPFLGSLFLTCATIDATKVMSQASCVNPLLESVCSWYAKWEQTYICNR